MGVHSGTDIFRVFKADAGIHLHHVCYQKLTYSGLMYDLANKLGIVLSAKSGVQQLCQHISTSLRALARLTEQISISCNRHVPSGSGLSWVLTSNTAARHSHMMLVVDLVDQHRLVCVEPYRPYSILGTRLETSSVPVCTHHGMHKMQACLHSRLRLKTKCHG